MRDLGAKVGTEGCEVRQLTKKNLAKAQNISWHLSLSTVFLVVANELSWAAVADFVTILLSS